MVEHPVHVCIFLTLNFDVTYSSTDNFLSSNPVYDWLTFCCANLILYQKKEMKMIKKRFFDEKQNNAKKIICKLRVAFFTLNSHDITMM